MISWMKASLSGFLVGVLLSACVATVQAPPPEPQVENVPPPPAVGMVWVGGHWSYTRRGWVWIGGSYVRPPRPGAVWVPGHWKHRRGGHIWISGHWR